MFQQSSEELNEENLLKPVIQKFQNSWVTGYDYTKTTPIRFKGKPMDRALASNEDLQTISMYVDLLMRGLLDWNLSLFPEKTRKEVLYYEREGGTCIYLSVLFVALVEHSKIASYPDVKLVQGYYKHAIRNDQSLLVQMLGKTHAGLHAFATIRGSVFDLSIRQEADFFDFSGPPVIIGNVPEGLEFVGFEETPRTVSKYIKMIAQRHGMKMDEWILFHMRELQYTKGRLESYMRRNSEI